MSNSRSNLVEALIPFAILAFIAKILKECLHEKAKAVSINDLNELGINSNRYSQVINALYYIDPYGRKLEMQTMCSALGYIDDAVRMLPDIIDIEKFTQQSSQAYRKFFLIKEKITGEIEKGTFLNTKIFSRFVSCVIGCVSMCNLHFIDSINWLATPLVGITCGIATYKLISSGISKIRGNERIEKKR